jgi:hypothetical protein
LTNQTARLVRAAYNNALLVERDAGAAFDHAVEMFMRARPLLSSDEARREVNVMLALAGDGRTG